MTSSMHYGLILLFIAGGCASQQPARVDLVRNGDLKVEAFSTSQWRLEDPSVTQEGGVMLVRGRAMRIGPETPKSPPSDRPVYVGVWVVTPSGELDHNFVLGLSETGEYSYRYLYRPPSGSTMVVAQIPDNPQMLTYTGPAPGTPTLGLADYGAPGGPVWVQTNMARWSESRQAYYDQTIGRLGGMGSESPGYRGGDVGVGGLRRAGGQQAIPTGGSAR